MNKSIKHLEFLREIAGQTTNYYNGKDLSINEFILTGFIERTLNTVYAIEPLRKELPSNPHLEYSIGILLRAQLLDALIVANIYRMINEVVPQEKVLNYLAKVLSDGFRHTIKYLNIRLNDGHITKDELVRAHDKLYELFRWALEDGYTPSATPPRLKNEISNVDHITADNLLKELINSEHYKALKDLHEYYTIYSKYDHFGLFYFVAMGQNPEESNDRIERIIDRLLFHCYFSHCILYKLNGETDSFIKSQLDKIHNYITKCR